MSEPTALYRLFGEDDVLLYVGISKHFGQRWTQHAHSQPWWPEVRRQSVEWHGSREDALAAEESAIKAESPAYNITHTERAPARSGERAAAEPVAPKRGTPLPRLSAKTIIERLPLAAVGGLTRDKFLPTGEAGRPSLFEFARCYYKGVRRMTANIALTRQIESERRNSPEIVALCRSMRHNFYSIIGIKCPSCEGSPPQNMACLDCGTEGQSEGDAQAWVGRVGSGRDIPLRGAA